MAIEKKYFHDKVVLLLLSLNGFLTILTSVMILLRLGSSNPNYHIVQYRADLGLSAFKNGTSTSIDAFIVFVWLIFIVNTILSFRTYNIKRDYSVIVLGFGLLLVVLSIIVSNALLILP